LSAKLVQSTLESDEGQLGGVRKVACAKAISLSRLPGLTYALNPYIGCAHACRYCYSQDVLRLHARGEWGTWVEAKEGLAAKLNKELRRAKPGTIGLGTVTDPYQPAEAKCNSTRECLEVLANYDHPVCIQTKSNLVVRDIDLIANLQSPEVGITITTLDESLSARLEPGASSSIERLEAAKTLSDAGIKVWVFLGPVILGANDSRESVVSVVRAAAQAGAKKILFDFYRSKPLADARMRELLGYEFAPRKKRLEARDAAMAACSEAGISCQDAF